MRLRTVAFLLLSFLLPVSAAHATPVHLWSHSYGDSDDQYLSACFADPFGNVIVVGSFYGTINITTPFTSLGRRDVIVAKFSPNGTPMWSDRIGFTSTDTGWSGTSDVVGNTIVVGSVGPSPNVRNAFIARYSPTGTQQWMKTFVAGDSIAYVEVVDTDPGKNIHVAGRFRGSINLGGTTLIAAADDDIFLAEFDAGGNHIWSQSFTSDSNFGELAGLGADPAGRPTLCGGFSGVTFFGGSPLISTSGYDIFVAKFTDNGAHLWSNRFGLTGDHVPEALAVDASGRIAITGESYGDIDFGGGTRSVAGNSDIFLAVLDAGGSHLWSKMFGTGNYESGIGVAFGANTDVLLSAYGLGTTPFSFGGAPLSGQASFDDLYVARFFVANGDHRWSTRFFGPGGGTYGFVGETGGQVFLGGTIGATTSFGGTPLVHQGIQDIFVARFGDQLTGAGPSLPRASLSQNLPNPFNPQTRIDYSLRSPAHAVIEIFDASGATVARLDDGEQAAGAFSVVWNGRDLRGRAVASGVYFYRLAGMPDVPARKMVLLK